MDPQTDPNIRFRDVIRGWSNNSQQAQARALLALSDDEMAKALKNKQDIILIPKHWWPDAKDTLEPEEPGWWYTVSDVICFQECRACKKRLGKDHQDATRCPKCPKKIRKRKNSGSKKTEEKNQIVRKDAADDRALRPRQDCNYAVTDSDDEDMEEDPEEMQQGHLCTSADPRRIGTGGGVTKEKPSANCIKPLPPSKPQTIKQYG